jgi:uncharacterized protein (UPF0335 family)
MSRPLITLAVINTFTTAVFTYIYNYYIRAKTVQDQKLEVLVSKINELERSIVCIQQSIEDLEENLNSKNNKVIESNFALSSKLDDFINYSYDVYDE